MLRVTLAAFSIFALLSGKGVEQEKAHILVTYPVGDLSVWSQKDGKTSFEPSILVSLLKNIEPDSWVASGKGEGEIMAHVWDESLVIAQSKEVHAQISALLDKMRKDASHQGAVESWKSTRHRTTRVYAVSDLVTPWPLDNKGKPDFDSLVDLIKATTGAGQWDAESEITVDETRYLLTVVHAPVVQSEIEDLLGKLREGNEQYASRIDNGKCGHCGLGAAPETGQRCDKCNILRSDPYTAPSRD
ncbi:hypothetical protein [Lacipirellula sp.]|uniref:hypothetical protein n=1 Tax=Lacipirellula sp. TaxID=2691419 RepID=UPI003D0C2EEE